MEVHIGGTKVVVEQGDITEQDVDAIAVAANDRLWMGGRLADTLKQKAGEDVETEAMKQGPLPVGEVAVTSAGELPIKHILHAVIMGQDLKPTEETIGRGVRSLIKKADELGIKTLAMPAFGTGMGKFPAKQAAKVMVEQLIDGLLSSTSLKEVRIILHNEGIYKAFVEEFESRFSK